MASLFPNFQEFNIQTAPNVTIHGIRAGSGPPILLLHGFPQTHHIWHHLAPALVQKYTVVLLDLRGYGQSSKPPSGPSDSHNPYAKSTMATDCVSVMTTLGFSKFRLLGHDRGARVAHKLCVDFPDRVEKVMFLDIAPTLAMFEQTTQGFATVYWHWFFLIQAAPFPEEVILKSQSEFAGKCFGSGGYTGTKGMFEESALGEYVKQFGDREGVHAMCEDYRAAATVDLEEAKADLKEGRKIRCPVRVLWGKKGEIERSFDALKEWRAVSEGEVSGEAVESGHYIPEEVPDVLLKHVEEFF